MIAPPAGLRRAERLRPYTSLKVGGAADLYLAVAGLEEAKTVLRWARAEGLACRWLGGGSNLLISDAGLDGLAARFTAAEVELPERARGEVVSAAGHSFPSLARSLARAGWSGLEWAANVPGTVGGAVVNNAGAFGSSVADTLAWAELLDWDGELCRLMPDQLDYSYRSSRLKRGELPGTLVTRAAFRVWRAPPDETVARVREYQRLRTSTQPRQLSAGSVFANPPGDHAGRLIEAAGLKGCRRGGAEISEQHANFIVNTGGTRARDVYGLISLVQSAVWQLTSTWLEPEIELLGRWSDAERAALASPLVSRDSRS